MNQMNLEYPKVPESKEAEKSGSKEHHAMVGMHSSCTKVKAGTDQQNKWAKLDYTLKINNE